MEISPFKLLESAAELAGTMRANEDADISDATLIMIKSTSGRDESGNLIVDTVKGAVTESAKSYIHAQTGGVTAVIEAGVDGVNAYNDRLNDYSHTVYAIGQYNKSIEQAHINGHETDKQTIPGYASTDLKITINGETRSFKILADATNEETINESVRVIILDENGEPTDELAQFDENGNIVGGILKDIADNPDRHTIIKIDNMPEFITDPNRSGGAHAQDAILEITGAISGTATDAAYSISDEFSMEDFNYDEFVDYIEDRFKVDFIKLITDQDYYRDNLQKFNDIDSVSSFINQAKHGYRGEWNPSTEHRTYPDGSSAQVRQVDDEAIYGTDAEGNHYGIVVEEQQREAREIAQTGSVQTPRPSEDQQQVAENTSEPVITSAPAPG